MPILNKAKGVYRGRALVQFVRVAGRVIWQARKIVGWNKIAGPYEASVIYSDTNKIVFYKTEKDEFNALKDIKDLYLRGANGRHYLVTYVRYSTAGSQIIISSRLTSDIAKKGDQLSFYQPVWG